MKLIEKVNLKRLEEVCNKNLQNYPKKNPNDNNKWYKMTLTDLQNYKEKVRKGVVEVVYKRKNEEIGGRLYSSGCIQHMMKPIRNYLLNGTLTDIDIVNCHPTIIKYLFDTYNIEDEFINDYIENREASMKKYSLLNKEQVLYIINNEVISSKQNKFLKNFHSNIYGENGLLVKMEKRFKEDKNDLIKKIYKYVNKKKTENKKGSVFSHILCYYEDIILDKMIKYMEGNDIEISVLMFDGLMVVNNNKLTEDFLRNLEEFILDKTRISVKIVYKSTDTEWKPIIEDVENEDDEDIHIIDDNGEKFSIEKSRQLLRKHWVRDKKDKVIGLDYNLNSDFIEYMNKFVCKFYEPICYGFRRFEKTEFKLYKEKQLEICLSSISGENNSKNTLLGITKNVYCKAYDKMDFIVDYKNGDMKSGDGQEIYNTYKRPKSHCVEDIEEKCNLFFNFLYEIISDSSEEVYEFILNWISIKLQYGKVGMAIILKGEMGIGKGTFGECLMNIIGEQYVFIDACGSRINRQFNSLESNKLIGIYEEMVNNSGDNVLKNEIMKHKITDKKSWVEFKGVEPYMTTNLCDYLFFSNGQNPMKIVVGDRRYVVNKVSNKMIGNKEYFILVNQNVKDNLEGLRYYFENRDVNICKMKPIRTDAYKRLMDLNEDIRQSFINDRLEEIMDAYECQISCRELFDKFKNYCIENNYTGSLNFKYFIDFIIDKTEYVKYKDCHKKTYIKKKE